MGLIMTWFLAEDDAAASEMVDYQRVLAAPNADVNIAAVVYLDDLDAIISGRTIDEVRAADGRGPFAQAGEAYISRLSSELVGNLAGVPDDALPVLAGSWADAVGHEEPFDTGTALWILQQIVPLFRQAQQQGMRAYEFGSS